LVDGGTAATANIVGTEVTTGDVALKLSMALAVPATDYCVLDYIQVTSSDA
jgi:hypothetical protein